MKKLSISMFVVFITLFGIFAVAAPAHAMTCNSATIDSTVSTYSHTVSAYFTYGTNYNQVALGEGTPTPPQTVAPNSYIEQLVTGLSGSTTYYYKLVVAGQAAITDVNNFTTPSCTPPPAQTCQDTTASNYGGALPCTYPQVCRDTTAINYGGALPCTYVQTCKDTTATNYGGTLPCNYYQQVYNYTCRDTTAINYGGTLPCNYYQQPIVYQQPVYQPQVIQPVYQPIVNNSLTVVTTQATQVLDTSAQLNSLIGSSANSSTNAWFEWGRTINLGNTTTIAPVGALPSVIHTDTLTGLDAGTTYYFRAVAQNSSLKTTGSILSFTTTGTQNPATIVQYVNRTPSSSLVLITSSVNRDQAIAPTLDNSRPHPGDEINYTVDYQNVGNSAITNLSLQVTLPQEVTYLSSTPNNPNILGSNLVFNLGTLKGNGQGSVTIKTQVNSDATEGTLLNFPATLSYVNPSGQPQSVNANVSAQVYSASSLGAFAFGAGFFPTNIFGWLLLLILILVLVLLAKYLYNKSDNQLISKKTTTTVDHQPLGKKTTTTTVEQ